MRYHIITYGCQMNKSDAERAAAVLEKIGYQKTDSEESADLIMVLACSVRQSAVDRIYGKTRIWQKMKEKRPLVTILSGCILKGDRKKLLPHFDFIFPICDLAKLPQKLKNLPTYQLTNYFAIHPHYQSDFQAYVPISTGCNNFCAYCVVPYVRGPEICRPAHEILDEARNLIKKGYKEITLLGQNVNSYKSPDKKRIGANKKRIFTSNSRESDLLLAKNINFPKLLQIINGIPGNFWLRFITSHPKDFSDELIKTMAKCEKICEYLHLPVQSGDNKTLRRMNRGYTVEHYKNIIEKIRKKIPGVAISTDVIVGFPGETEKHFQNTADLMKEIKFDMVYIAEYSPRSQTAAAKLKDDVPKKEKEKRREVLTEILKNTALEQNKKYIGKMVEVLIDLEDKDYFYGKTRTFKTVKMKKSPTLKIGEFAKAKIITTTSFGLFGT